MAKFEWDDSLALGIRAIDGHEMGANILDFLVDWLACHIKGTDQGYNRFIQMQESPE